MAAPLEHAMQLEVTVARERFRSRIFHLAAFSIAVDAAVAVLSYFSERGAPHAFSSVWAALFWTARNCSRSPHNCPTMCVSATRATRAEARRESRLTSLAFASFQDLWSSWAR